MVEGFKHTELGIIPNDWDVVCLNDCLELLTDFEANGSFEDVAKHVTILDKEDFAWYVRATDLENNTEISKVKYVDEKTYKFLAKTKLFGGEVLITKRGEIGKVYFFEMKTNFATVAPNLYLLKLNDRVVPFFIYSFFKSVGNRLLIEKNASTTLGALYKNDVKAITFPLPTKAEQTAIATALNDADALIQKLEQLIAKKRNIKTGVMQELLKPKAGWKWTTVDKLGKPFGGLSGKAKADFKDGNCPYIPFMNVMSNPIIDTTYFDYVKITPTESQHKAERGDLFFNGSSETPEEVGMCSVLLEDIPNLYLNSFCFGFRLFKEEKNDGLYLAYFFRSSYGRKIFYILAQGATRHNLSKSNFLKIEIQIPEPDEQEKIATILRDMNNEIQELEKQLEKNKMMKQGMMQSLLTGKIRLV